VTCEGYGKKKCLLVSMFNINWNFLQETRKATIDLRIICVPTEVEAVHLPNKIQLRYRLSELAQ
jgi:hypothetical protein